MARPQDPKREKARQLWEESGGARGILTEIAEQLDVKREQVSRWKSEDQWDKTKRNVTKSVKRNVTKQKKEKERNESAQRKLQRALIESVKENEELTENQKLFCFHYVQNYNGTQSYLKVYECDYETAKRNASRLLTFTHIKEEIARLKEIAIEMNYIPSAEETLAIYGSIARADMREFVNFGTREEIDLETGDKRKRNYLHFKEMEEVDGRAITDITLGKDGAKIKTGDKMQALKFLAKFHGLDEPKATSIENDGFIEALGDMTESVWEE